MDRLHVLLGHRSRHPGWKRFKVTITMGLWLLPIYDDGLNTENSSENPDRATFIGSGEKQRSGRSAGNALASADC
ncbi:hypothetical protein RB195_017913 [Necator americanus]|uniref:Uncharacterized protein n=1 Tax=Necator americanus TaxID=51031 RepID=A0ABR1C9L5_NECAM